MSINEKHAVKGRKKNNGGFTQVEQIVIIVLIMILASGIVFGIMRWVEWTNFKRQNEYARTLFVAAQNQLTEYSESGQLPVLQEAISDTDGAYTNVLDVTRLKGQDGKSYELTSVWPESDQKDQAARYQGNICYLIGTEKDYKAYLRGEAEEDLTALYDMFRSYLYDTSILNGTICVEFTPEDGQVFSVLYSDRASGFVYDPDHENTKGTVDITDRQAAYRKARMTGYYGVDMLSKATSTKTEKPSIADVKLNNEETLNLSFRLKKIKSAVQELTYEISVCDKKTKKPLLVLTLDGTQIKNELFMRNIPCNVTRYSYGEDGRQLTAQKLGTYMILAWIDKEETVRVVLDAADLNATSALYYDVYEELTDTESAGSNLSMDLKELKSTYSFRRFGVNADDIYCTIQGSGTYYKTTAKKQSNTEHAYFASVQKSESDGKTSAAYGLKNARHLYNVRYMEDYTEAEREKKGYEGLQTANQVTYQLAKDVDWKDFLKKEVLYAGGEVEEEADFPSLKQLRKDSVFEGRGIKTYTISGLSITEASNGDADIYGTKDTGAVGLFVTNEGTIRDLILDKITVKGTSQVGAFCGENAGVLENLTTGNSDPRENPSVLSGREYVGGITGMQKDGASQGIRYENLQNRGEIAGRMYVGGILGMAIAQESQKIEILQCKNYGSVRADESVGAEESKYIGGIAGYCEAKGQHAALTIRNCTSSPQYTDNEVLGILSDADELDKKLKGVYVGGIVGYNRYGMIRNCNTEKESGTKEGYIFGYQFVGGIVGYSTGTGNIDGIDDTKRGINAAHVFGDSYVGGIAGCNADIKNIENGIIVPDSDPNLVMEVSNWTNRGVVAARSNFAGGITGYNTGIVYDCSSNVDNSVVVRNLSQSPNIKGNYIGGITGYNNGLIGSQETVSIICYVTGTDYIGGVAGYNDQEGGIANYAVAGGYVRGQGCYAGGYAGFNASLDLTDGRYISSDPNEVTGKYCVGGTLGANVTAPESDTSASFRASNFLGTLKADAFAGGFIGYNKLVPEQTSKEAVMDKAGEHIEKLNGASDLESAVAVLEDFGLGNNGKRLVISGDGSGGASQSQFGGLTAKIYVGGVVGYNDESTRMTIRNVMNLTPVSATSYIHNEKEQPGRTRYTGELFTYSYAGGMIGKVSRYVVLDNCGNKDAGDVITVGTYLGGLCEVNEGLIENSSVSSIGYSSADYVGGIAGVNKADGVIRNCTFQNRTVTGRNYVGGIVAENFGSIQNIGIQNGKVTAAECAGGITGYGAEKSYILLNQDLSLNLSGTGTDIGGIAGKNAGTLTAFNGSALVRLSGSVSGSGNVGGIVGRNLAGDVTSFYNEASVTAENGNAGGIVGADESSPAAVIRKCKNSGTVSATKKGNAGGILGNNKGTISECSNRGSISAANGICGGIAGVNEGTIDDCFTGAETLLSFIGKTYAGGICGINRGFVIKSRVFHAAVSNLADSKESALGGITGRNEGTIQSSSVGEESYEIIIRSNAADTSLGGVAGMNTGTIKGFSNAYCEVNAKLSFVQTEQSYYGNIGGIAGSSTGKIQYCQFSGIVEGTGNNPQLSPEYNPNTDFETNGSRIYGYGGITGVNGDPSAKTSGQITDCIVKTAKITGLGDPNNVANIGGITGVNGLGAQISKVTVGSDQEKKNYRVALPGNSQLVSVKNAAASVYIGTGGNTSAYAHTGGIAGLNSGAIKEIQYDKGKETYDTEVDRTSVIIENYRGHVGGIIGSNRRSGNVSRVATGKSWVVFAPQNAQDNGCGGIVGYQALEDSMTYCVNRATVEKSAVNSNGVGGMVGRLETATSSNFNISYCTNYGTIYGRRRVGGMIGVWKYYGGTISDCVNYGAVSSIDSEGVSGIVGCFYDFKTTAAYIVRCENHGTITGSYAGGIAGKNAGGNAYLRLEKCVNTGLIQPSDTNGGIMGAMTGLISGSSILSCNNYGFGNVSGGSSKNLNGIVAKNSASVAVSKCFGIADTTYPISNTHGDGSNYYLSDTQSGIITNYYDKDGNITAKEPDAFYVRKMEMEGNGIQSQNYMNKLVWDDSTLSDGNRPYFQNTSSGTISLTYAFTFSTEIDLTGMDLYWNRGSDGRVTDYTIYYSPYTDDSTWKEYASMSNATDKNYTAPSKETILNGPVSARQIKIVITRSVNKNGGATNACLIRAHFKGNVFGNYAYDGNAGYAVKRGDLYAQQRYETSTELKSSQQNKSCFYKGLGYEEVQYMAASGSSEKGKGTGVNVRKSEDGSTYKLVAGAGDEASTVGLSGFSMDPTAEFMGGTVGMDVSLKVMGDSTDNIRYQVFQADDPYFNVDAREHVTALEIPVIRSFSDAGNASYKVQWSASDQASYYDYEAVYRAYDGTVLARKKDTVYHTEITLPVSDIDGTAIHTIEFRVRAGTDTVGQDDKLHEVWSEYCEEYEKEIPPVLMTPQYHLELVRDDKDLKYQVFLDNQEDYRRFLRANGIPEDEVETALQNVRITVRANQTDITFTAAKGKSSDYYSGNNGNAMFAAHAAHDKGTFTSSSRPLRESQAPESGVFTGDGDIASLMMKPDESNGVGFKGTTGDTLSYQLKIGFTKYVVYMRSELTAVDTELGVPVAVSTSQLRTSDTTVGSVATSLSSLPANLMDESAYTDLLVRSYPAMMSNNVAYTGHTVNIDDVKDEGALGLTKEQIRQLYVTPEKEVTMEPEGNTLLIQKSNDSATLMDGFVIELLSDGTYTLYYNALLEYNDYLDYAYDVTGNQQKKTQVFYYRLTEERSAAKKPVIFINDEEEKGMDGDPDSDSVTITWDLNKAGYEGSDGSTNYKKGAVYDYVLTGYTSDGTAVQIDAGTYITGTDGENSLTYSTFTWNYRRITVSVSRRGTENNNGMTTVFPSGALRSWDLKLRFSQITKPDVSLHRNEENIVQKNSLIYDITWEAIPKGERSELASYRVLVERSLHDTAATKDYTDRTAFETALAKAKELYAGKPQVKITEEANQAAYVWADQPESPDSKVVRTMVLQWTADPDGGKWSISKSLTSVWEFGMPEDSMDSGTCKKLLDLNDYERGEAIEISVQAIAKEDARSYRDGVPGVVREMTLPSRLDVPDVTEMKSRPSYHAHGDTELGEDEKTYMTLEEFEEGIRLTLHPSKESGVLQGRYELAAAVFDSPEDVLDTEKVANPGDGETKEGYWNTGALTTLVEKASERKMEGSLTEAEYVLETDGRQYAGKWLKVALRSISESNVSSNWSDEDETTEETINYKWIQIPRLQVETPKLSQDTKTLYYANGIWKGDPTQTEPADVNDLDVLQTSLSFEAPKNADYYQVQLIRSVRENAKIDPDESYTIQYIDWIYIENNSGDPNRQHVFYATSDPGFEEETYRQTPGLPVCIQNEQAVYLGDITGRGSFIELPYKEEASEGPLEDSAKVTAVSYLQKTLSADEKTQLSIVLPDAESIGGYTDDSYRFTSQVSVQANVSQEALTRYEHSRISNWYRMTGEVSNVVELPDYGDAPSGMSIILGSSNRETTAYELIAMARNWLVYQIQVQDASGNWNHAYISAYGSGISDITTIALLPKSKYAGLAGHAVRVRAAAIIKGSANGSTVQGGLSKWTDWQPLGSLPALPEIVPEEAAPDSGGDTEPQTKVTE